MSFTVLPTPQFINLEPGFVTVSRRSELRLGDDVPADVPQSLVRILPRGDGSTPFNLTRSSDMPAEGYELVVTMSGIDITASHLRGFAYGLQRLQQIMRENRVPLGRITDFPSLALRGFQINFSALRHMGLKEGLSVLDAMARWKLNAALLEYGDRYPYGKHRAICAGDALSREELHTLLAHARSLGIEPIPLHQCLGHVGFILRHDEYSHLREEDEKRDQWCPLKPESYDLFRECIDDVMETHGAIRYLHIGGDETRRLGNCPECAGVAAKHGPGRLYLDFVVRAIQYVKAQGVIPIVWDDMLCRHSDVIGELPRDAVIMYWDYWTTHSPSATFVARPDGKGVVVDRRWKSDWAGELDSVEGRMIEHFARPIDFESDLSTQFLAQFGKYLGDQFPKRVRAFPYLEYYQDLGFQVICGPAGGSNQSTWRKLPDWPRYADNINAFSRRAHEANALGVLTTSWYDFPIEAVVPAIMYTGQSAWNVSTGADAESAARS